MAFEKTENQDQGTPTTPVQPSPAPDQGPFMVIGDRAYHTADDLKKKVESADEHIARVEAENAALAAQVEAQAKASVSTEKVEALLSKLDTQANTGTTSQVSTEDLVGQVAQQVRSQMTAEQRELAEKINMDKAEAAAKEHFGDKYNEMVEAKAGELGMSLDKANDLAKTSPDAFRKLFLSEQHTNSPLPSSPSVNLDAGGGQPQEESVGNWTKMTGAQRRAWMSQYLAKHT